MNAAETAPVVVGVDGSQSSRQALLWANSIAAGAGTRVRVIAAWQPPASYGYLGFGAGIMPPEWDIASETTKATTAVVDDVFGASRPAGLTIEVAEGNAAKVLIEASQDAHMLVVGSRGHGGFSGLLLGSVSAACAEHASCPVLVIHGSDAESVAESDASAASAADQQ